VNLADSIAADLARFLIVQSQPPKKHKFGRPGSVLHYDKAARALKKRQRDARKRRQNR
jgi:hypothetical protein